MRAFLKVTGHLVFLVPICFSFSVFAKETSNSDGENVGQINEVVSESEAANDQGLAAESGSEESLADEKPSTDEGEQPVAEEKPKKKLFGLPKIPPLNKWFAKKKENKNNKQDEGPDAPEAQAKIDETETGAVENEDTANNASSETPEGSSDTAIVNLEGAVNEDERVVKLYRVSSAKMARAQAQIADAIGLKEEALLMHAEADALEADSAKGQGKKIKSYTKTSKKTNKAISKRLEEKKELDAEQQKKFAKGMLLYAKGAVATSKFAKEMRPFYSTVLKQGNVATGGGIEGWLSKAKILLDKNVKSLGTALYIAKSSPKVIYEHGQTITKLRRYAKSQNIDVPDDANKELDGFSSNSDWKNV
ncbi:MAG: hypothetical protein COB61_009645 [Thiotrichales bacterium]|nr:hypothetical protein [Thiotrichales bacterium]